MSLYKQCPRGVSAIPPRYLIDYHRSLALIYAYIEIWVRILSKPAIIINTVIIIIINITIVISVTVMYYAWYYYNFWPTFLSQGNKNIYSLLHIAVSTAANGEVIDEKLVWKDVEGRGCDLIKELSRNLPGRTELNHKILSQDSQCLRREPKPAPPE
jgi:hypothetical protein